MNQFSKSSDKDAILGLLEKVSTIVFSLGSAVGFAYILANIIIAVCTVFIIKIFPIKSASSQLSTNNQVNFRSSQNFHSLKKVIIKRNVFNKEGKYPDEGTEVNKVVSVDKNFTIEGHCDNSVLPYILTGIIYSSEAKKSVALLYSKGDKKTKSYRKNEELEEGVFIFHIDKRRAILNNKDTKECFELREKKSKLAMLSSSGRGKDTMIEAGTESATLESSWVEAELGVGFSKAMSSARMVPNMTNDGSMKGFKVFAIKRGSLFDKSGFKNRDAILEVNGTSITADKGFLIYEALRDEKEVSVRVLRKNKPINLNIIIK